MAHAKRITVAGRKMNCVNIRMVQSRKKSASRQAMDEAASVNTAHLPTGVQNQRVPHFARKHFTRVHLFEKPLSTAASNQLGDPV